MINTTLDEVTRRSRVGAAIERYLALADDEEGVSSGSLPDDVFLVLVVSLHTHKFKV